MRKLHLLSLCVLLLAGCNNLRISKSGQGRVYKHKSQDNGIVLQAQESVGWKFVRWEGDAVSSANPLRLKSDSQRNIRAIFERDDYSDLPGYEAWLNINPHIRDAIKFEYMDGTVRTYQNWPSKLKYKFKLAFAKAWRQQSSGLIDPPSNIHPNIRDDDAYIKHTLPAREATDIYLAYVAHSIALEMGNRVGWSLHSYNSEQLALLLDSRDFFKANRDDGGYTLWITKAGRSMLSPPEVAWDWGKQWMGPHRYFILRGLVQWSRDNMFHYTGPSKFGIFDRFWQYRGYPPVARVIEGTYRGGPPDGLFRNWTAGCWGTSGFFKSVCRAFNIPVTFEFCGGHNITSFISDNMFLSHGDDPYHIITRYDSFIPTDRHFVDHVTFDQWFHSSAAPDFPIKGDDLNKELHETLNPDELSQMLSAQIVGCDRLNVSRRPRDLAMEYMSPRLLRYRCEDIESGVSREDSEVNNYLRNYSVEELEARNVWTIMDSKIESVGGCEGVSDLIRDNLPDR